MLVIRAITTSFVTPNRWATCVLAGAIMLDDTGEINVNAETTNVAAHFFLRLQLRKGKVSAGTSAAGMTTN